MLAVFFLFRPIFKKLLRMGFNPEILGSPSEYACLYVLRQSNQKPLMKVTRLLGNQGKALNAPIAP